VTTGTDERLRRFARSRRFLLGRPRDLAFVPLRLLFLRALAADDPVTGRGRSTSRPGRNVCWPTRVLLDGEPEVIPAAEQRRRERMRRATGH
jgi:hypothetical protein